MDEDIKLRMDVQEFKDVVARAIDRTNGAICRCSSRDKDRLNVLNEKVSALNALKGVEINSRGELESAIFKFNNGNLRPKEETEKIEIHKEKEQNVNPVQVANYDEDDEFGKIRYELRMAKTGNGSEDVRYLMDLQYFKDSIASTIYKAERMLSECGEGDEQRERTLRMQLDSYYRIENIKINSREDLIMAEWMFNGGGLRSDTEINEKLSMLKDMEMQKKRSEAYKNDKTLRVCQFIASLLWLILPIAIAFLISLFVTIKESSSILDFIESILFNFIGIQLFAITMLPFVIPILMIIGAILGVAWSNYLDYSWCIPHNYSQDASIAGAAAASSIGIILGCRGQSKESKTEI